MRAVICSSFNGIDALEFGELADPVPGPGQVLVDVHAAALSFMDTLMVAGRYQMKPALPFVPGSDAAGVVLAVGDGVQRVCVGDRVACSHWHGGMAERMVAPESGVVKLPDSLGFEIASTVRYAYGTARYALQTRAHLRPGETVFVSGAAGGVGMAAVDVARQMGATVIAGTSSAAKGEVARQQGAAHVIDYSCEPVRDRLLELTQGRGVDVYFDNVGGSLFATVSRAMAWGGRMSADRIHERRSTQPRHEPAAVEELQRGGMLFGARGWSGSRSKVAPLTSNSSLRWRKASCGLKSRTCCRCRRLPTACSDSHAAK